MKNGFSFFGFSCFLRLLALLFGVSSASALEVSFVGPHQAHLVSTLQNVHLWGEVLSTELGYREVDGERTVLQTGTSLITGEYRVENLEPGDYIFYFRYYAIMEEGEPPEWRVERSRPFQIDGTYARGSLRFDEVLENAEVSETDPVWVPANRSLTIQGTLGGRSGAGRITVHGDLSLVDVRISDVTFYLYGEKDHAFTKVDGGTFRLMEQSVYDFSESKNLTIIPSGGAVFLTEVVDTELDGREMTSDAVVFIDTSEVSLSSNLARGVFQVKNSRLFSDWGTIRLLGTVEMELSDEVRIDAIFTARGEARVRSKQTTFEGAVGIYEEAGLISHSCIFNRMTVEGVGPGKVKVDHGLFNYPETFFATLNVRGGYPAFNHCEFNGNVNFENRNGAEFLYNVFYGSVNFNNASGGSIPAEFPAWPDAPLPSPNINYNAFMGRYALITNNVGNQVVIGRNYYGDARGYEFRTVPPDDNNFLGTVRAKLGGIYYRSGSGSLGFLEHLKTSPVSTRRRDFRALPSFWVNGVISGQNTISHNNTHPSIALKGRETLLSVHLGTSEESISGLRVYAQWGGQRVDPHNAVPALRRDISNYSVPMVRTGRTTYNFILPPTWEDEQTAVVYLDVSGVPGYEQLSMPPYAITSRVITLTDPPERPLRIWVQPLDVRVLLFSSYGRADGSEVARMLRNDLPQMVPLPPDKLQVRELPVAVHSSPSSLVTSMGLLHRLAMNYGVGRWVRTKILREPPDFVVLVLPQALATAYFPNTWFDLQTFDGVMFNYSNRVLFVAEHKPDAVFHELGHGVGLYTQNEQYHLFPESGLPMASETAFAPTASGHHRIFHFAGENDFWYQSNSETYDIMGNISRGDPSLWTRRATMLAFHQWFQDNLRNPAPVAAAQAAEPVASPAADPTVKRWLLRGAVRERQLVPEQTLVWSDHPDQIEALPPVQDPFFNTQRLIAVNDQGERLVEYDFYPPYADLEWQATFDLPVETVALTQVSISGRSHWHSGTSQFYRLWDEGQVIWQRESRGLTGLTISEPLPGAIIDDELNLSWTVQSQQAPPAEGWEHVVYYRSDPSHDWELLGQTGENALTVSAKRLPVGPGLELQLETRDGFTTVSAVVGGLTVLPQDPEVSITRLADGFRGYPGRIDWDPVWPKEDRSPFPFVRVERQKEDDGTAFLEAKVGFTGLTDLHLTLPGGEILVAADLAPEGWTDLTGFSAGGDTLSLEGQYYGDDQWVWSWRRELTSAESLALETGQVTVTVHRDGEPALTYEVDWGDLPLPTGIPLLLEPFDDGQPWSVGQHLVWAPAAEEESMVRVRFSAETPHRFSWSAEHQRNVRRMAKPEFAPGQELILTVGSLRQEERVEDGVLVRVGSLQMAPARMGQMAAEKVEWPLQATIMTGRNDPVEEVVWTSSIDGLLGESEALFTPLSVGTHQLTCTVTTQAGRTASAALSVVVSEDREAVFSPWSADSLTVHHATADPENHEPIWLSPGASNQLVLRLPWTGMDLPVAVTLWVTPPQGPEFELGREELLLEPFQRASLSFYFTPAHSGEYLFRALLEPLEPGRMEGDSREYTRSFSTPPDRGSGLLTVASNPPSGGAVEGGGRHPAGAGLVLSAYPIPGAQFLRWQEGATILGTEPQLSLTVMSNQSITAYFAVPDYQIEVTGSPAGSGFVSGGGTYAHGETVLLTASDSWMATFTHWEEDGEYLSGDPVIAFTASQNRSITGVFAVPSYTVSLLAEPEGWGITEGSGTYPYNSRIEVRAIPADGYMFSEWRQNGDRVSGRPVYEMTVYDDVTLVAHFIEMVTFAGGSGTPADPFQIATEAQLDYVRFLPEQAFILTADLDLDQSPWNEGKGWIPIGSWERPFSGTFHGQNHRITGLKQVRENWVDQGAGLFGLTDRAWIGHLTLAEVDIVGLWKVGALAGETLDSLILNIHSTGSVVANDGTAGGLVGSMEGGVMSYCSSSATVFGGWGDGGGLFGFSSGTVQKSWATGAVSGEDFIGGLGGRFSGLMEDCYATGSVTLTGSWGETAGGLLGGEDWQPGEVRRSYATGLVSPVTTQSGGLIGIWSEYWDDSWGEPDDELSIGIVVDSYWNTETSGHSSGQWGEGRTTPAMTYPFASSTYIGWDFNSTWDKDETGVLHDGYPYLRPWQEGAEFILIYQAGPGGYLEGETVQMIAPGGSGTAVEAIPEPGAIFTAWSDGWEENPRLDEGVDRSREVFARFASLGLVAIDWYVQHGLTPTAGEIWSDLDDLDPLGKGMTLREEFFAGTDPTDLNSRFVASPVGLTAGGNLILKWSSVVGKVYGIERSTDLRSWSPWPESGQEAFRHTADGPESVVEIPLDPNSRGTFFRVVIIDPRLGNE